MRHFLLATVAAGAVLTLGKAMEKKSAYPPSNAEKVVDRLHGVEVADPYRWLEEADKAEVRAWVDKQSEHTKGVLDKLPGRDKIHARLEKLLDIGTLGTPVPRQGRYFYTRRDGKQNQAILYVREGLKGKDRALVDPNTLAADGTVAMDWWFPSRDGKLLAYGLSKDGSEQSVLHIRDVATGKDLDDRIDRTRYCSVAWLPDGKGFYYTRNPAAGSVPKGEENYHKHVFFHELGTEPAKDVKVLGEGRPAEDMPSVALSPDGRWLAVTEHQGWAKSEVFLAERVKGKALTFLPLVEKVNAVFDVVVRNERLYVRTNHEAPRYRLFTVDPAKPARDQWQELIPEGKEVLDSVTAIGDLLVAEFMQQASSRLRLYDLAGKQRHEIKLPTLGTVAGLGGEWDGKELLFGFQSFTVPQSIYHCSFESLTAAPELWDRVQADIDFAKYEVEQVKYPSKDGTEITMFLAHKKGLEKNGKTSTLLYGYGGFNISLTPVFSASRFLFLEQGGLIAIPNLRGGGEYGEEWHQAGMLGKKQNVFDDFLGAADWLIREKYTSSPHLVIQGGSNGGLLVGAAVTQRPEVFRAVVCQVPLLDMVRYHKFLIARLWIPEYGSADAADQFKWLYAYSPYHRVKDGTAYPAVLLEAAESDSRVDALHARKMAARLQAATSSDQPILLRLETKAGHGAGKPRGKIVEELTDTWSFIFWQLGIKM